MGVINLKFPIIQDGWIIDYFCNNLLIFRKDSGGKLEIHNIRYPEIQDIIFDLTQIKL